jgi:uncharacterized Zn finger protein (UPF0148 family)
MSDCKHPGFLIKEGKLLCATCGEPSASVKWKQNVYGKAVPQQETENKGLTWPPESKRRR